MSTYSYRLAPVANADVTITGLSGATLAEGAVVTGAANLRAISVQNGLAKVNYTVRTPDVQRGCHMLQLPNASGTFVDAMEADQADWSYFAISLTNVYDRATVIESSGDQVRVAFQYDSLNLTSYPGGPNGMPYRDAAQGLNYAQGAVNPNWKLITSCVLVKEICMQRNRPGYFVGWHSAPYIGLPNALIAPYNSSDTTYGERELGDGGGNAACWASSGRVARWPAWGDDVDGRWTAQGLGATANKIWWAGIKDPRYAPYNSAGWIAVQGAGYPAMQAAGPYYMAGIHYDTAAKPFARFMATPIPREFANWKVGTLGGGVSHFNEENHTPGGHPYAHQIFVGGFYYAADSSNTFANEPSATVQTRVLAEVNALSWPKF